MTLRSQAGTQDPALRGDFDANSQQRLPLANIRATAARPFLKWAGGKTRLLPKLLPYIPAKFDSYHEPFVGGGAMFFAVRSRVARVCYLSDLNDELVNAWQVMRDGIDALAPWLARYRAKDSKEFYYSVRTSQPDDPVERAARFIYLNQTAWNGLWRVNKWGEFNVPWGNRAFRGFPPEDLSRFHESLAGVEIELADFADALKAPRRGDFVYLDPPYLPLSETSKFYLYTERRFRQPDLIRLASSCQDLTMRGVAWMLSNRDTPMVREAFDFARIIRITARRSVAAQNKRDVEAIDSPEVIVLGDPDI